MKLKNLTSLRDSAEITQSELGKIIGVNRTSISRWENGIEIIPIRKAIKVANYFNTNLDYLFGISSDKNKKTDYKCDLNVSGNRVITFRKTFKLTLRELAKILNTTSSTLSAYEQGRTLILTAFAYDISLKYNISIDWLIGNSDVMYVERKLITN